MQKGNIGVTTENIFPIIKKFLYSDHEIFLRELVSNAVDATQKLKTLASKGEFKGEMGDLTIKVSLGKDTITISDRAGVRKIVTAIVERKSGYVAPDWIAVDPKTLTAKIVRLPVREDVRLPVNEQLLVEFYSR